jgi:hypothetical protein
MKQRSKNLIAFVLAASFAFAILCSTFAAPGQALAAVSGCSQTAGAMEMAGCEHPSYLCGLDSSANFLSQGALSPTPNDSLKNALGMALGEVSIASSNGAIPLGWRELTNALPAGSHKVSIRLFNSVLNL